MGELMMNDSNFYLVQLKPFSPEDRHNPDIVRSHQSDCIKFGISGMGWAYERFFETDERMMLKDMYCDYLNYSRQYEGKAVRIITSALNIYRELKPGDYLLTRLDDNSCYIGKVKSDAYHDSKTQAAIKYGLNYSWIVDVEWKAIGDALSLPGSLRGELGKRLNTIQRIYSSVSRFNIIKEYGDNVEKIILDKDNFTDAFDAIELEDLVSCYIQELHKDEHLKFIPSTCKSDTKKFEFLLTDGRKKITLQVKNKKVINSDEYIEDLEQYSKIYLFSGISVTPMPKNDNLIVISKEQLFEYLNNNFSDDSYFGQRLNKIYKLEN